jgi:predicted PurR-regulated permease PerM
VKIQGNFDDNIGKIIQAAISATATSFISLLLIPVYAVLFLYERNSFVFFLAGIGGKRFRTSLHSILQDVIHSYSNFVRGMVMVYFIVGCLNTVGLLALGIPHALLFGMLTAVMTIIPYVGIIVSALIPISIAWLTKDSLWYPVGVIAVFAIVQYLEANVIFPRVVATKLKISTWAMLVAILTGSLLWGISGMILFIPLLGIFKIMLDYIPEWSSIKFLLEREEPVIIKKIS